MSSKGIILLFLCAVVLFIIYIASSEQTTILPGSSFFPGSITVFAPMPGTPPLQSFLPISQKENFTVKFGKRAVPQTPMTPVQRTQVDTDCPPPPPPPQQVESVNISYSHGVPHYEETAESIAQVVNSGVQISRFNPLMIL